MTGFRTSVLHAPRKVSGVSGLGYDMISILWQNLLNTANSSLKISRDGSTNLFYIGEYDTPKSCREQRPVSERDISLISSKWLIRYNEIINRLNYWD